MDPRATPTPCFFCNELIEEKRSMEHIIPDYLLAMLGLKEKELSGEKHVQYSRIKVPAHKQCNETFASRYESDIRQLLLNPELLYDNIAREDFHPSLVVEPSTGPVDLFRTWLMKLYYGLFYYDSLKSTDPNWVSICTDIVESENFKLIRQAYSQNVGFLLPSSLFVFRTRLDSFDLVTLAAPGTILLKYQEYVYVMCISDGLLTQAYMTKEITAKLQERFCDIEAKENHSRIHLLLLAEIVALRLSVPKSPSFIVEDGRIHNLSFNTMVKNPSEFYQIDEDRLSSNRTAALELLNGIVASGDSF